MRALIVYRIYLMPPSCRRHNACCCLHAAGVAFAGAAHNSALSLAVRVEELCSCSTWGC